MSVHTIKVEHTDTLQLGLSEAVTEDLTFCPAQQQRKGKTEHFHHLASYSCTDVRTH